MTEEEQKIFNLLHDIYNRVAKEKMSLDESVRLYLSLIVMAFKKAGATSKMIPTILHNVNNWLSQSLKGIIE